MSTRYRYNYSILIGSILVATMTSACGYLVYNNSESKTESDSSNIKIINNGVSLGGSGTNTGTLNNVYTIDPNFGNQGLVTVDTVNGSRLNSAGTMLQIDSSDRLLISGYSSDSANSWPSIAVTWRLSSSGQIDTTFGSNGIFFFASSPYNRMVAAFENASYGIDLLGFYDNGNDTPTIWSLDPSGLFIGNNTSSFGAEVEIFDGTPGTNGSYFTCGAQYSNYAAVTKFKADRSVDTSFNGSGRVIFTSVPNSRAHACALDSSGKLVVVGEGKPGGGAGTSTDLLIFRLNPNGMLDNTFNGSGYKVIDQTSGVVATNESSSGLAIDSNNNIYIAGWANDGTKSGMALWKIDSDGAADPAFGVKGAFVDFTFANGATGSSANKVLIDSTGNLYVAGRRTEPTNGTYTDMTVWQINSMDGTLKTDAHLTNGILTWTNPNLKNSWATDLKLDSAGRLIIMGGADDAIGNNHLQIWRYDR